MNPLARLFELFGHPITPPPPVVVGGPMKIGMNMGTIFYFNAEPVYVDLLKQAGNALNLAQTDFAALDANGWPNEDFIFGSWQRLPPDTPLNQTYTILVDGDPGTVTLPLANYWTLVTTTYDSPTNKGTIVLNGPSSTAINLEGPRLQLINTKKTAVSAAGSGVTRMRLPRVGYESTPDQLVTNEFVAQMTAFESLRFMKASGTESNYTIVSYANYPKRASNGMFGIAPNIGDPQLANMGIMPIEDIVAICNACHVNLWMCMNGGSDGTLGAASQEYGTAAYINAHLTADLFAEIEFCNEWWNFGYQWYAFGVNQLMAEINGFWNDTDPSDRGLRKLVSAVRTSNVLTCTMNVAHNMINGQVLGCYISGNKSGAVTVVSPTVFSIPDVGANATLSLTAAGGGIAALSNCCFDGQVYPSQLLSQRWHARRATQMSDNIRSAVGSDWGTRIRPVYMTQSAQAALYRAYEFKDMMVSGLGTTIAAKFTAFGGGAYIFGGNPDGSRITNDYAVQHTPAEYVAAYIAAPDTYGNPYYAFDVWKAFAVREGVPLHFYELGSDTKMYKFGDMTWYDYDAEQLRLATLAVGWTAVEQNWCDQQSLWGIDRGMQFNLEMIPAATYDGAGYWGMTYNTTVISAKQQAFINYAASPASPTRNVIPGTFDARAYINRYIFSSDPFPTPHNINAYFPNPAGLLIYLAAGSVAGAKTVSFQYKTLVANNHTMNLQVGTVDKGSVSFPSLGVGNTGVTTPVSFACVEGVNNVFSLTRDADTSDFEIHNVIVA